MAFHHRKLIADTLNETLIQICSPYCDPTKNLTGVCPTGCIYLCYLTCKPSFLPQLSPPPPPPPPPCFPTTLDDDPAKRSHNIPLPLKLSLAILATTFSILCFYAIYRFCKSWYRSRHRSHPHPEESETHDDFLDGDHGPVVDHPIWYIRTVGLNPSIISAITICKYKKGEGLVEGTECSVCLNEFQEDETLRLLPKCNHAFHIPCIDTWLISHTNCPLCRAGIVRNLSTSPSPEMVVDNSIPVEETQLGISENNRESGRELRVGIAEEVEPSVENGTKVNEIPEVGSCDRLVVDEVQPVRRSVSLDSSSAAMISAAMATSHHPFQSHGNLDRQLVKLSKSTMGFDPKRVHVNQSLLRLVGSSSIGRSLQKGPILMKRSFSSGGKILLSRHSRSQSRSRSRSRDMVLPL